MEAGDMKLQTDAWHLSLRDGCDTLQIKVELVSTFFQRSNDTVKPQPIMYKWMGLVHFLHWQYQVTCSDLQLEYFQGYEENIRPFDKTDARLCT